MGGFWTMLPLADRARNSRVLYDYDKYVTGSTPLAL